MSETVLAVESSQESLCELVQRLREHPEAIVLTLAGQPVARLIPLVRKQGNGAAFAKVLLESPLTDEEAEAWLQDLKEAREALIPQPDRWQ